MRPPDQADLFSELDDEHQAALLPELHPADSADILEELDDEEVAELVATLPTETVIRIVDQMEPDEAADLLGDIHPAQAQAVLAGLEDPDEVRPLLLHADDSAGGLMTSEFLALRRRMTAGEAIQAVREWKPEVETVYHLFVVDRYGKLCGADALGTLWHEIRIGLMLGIAMACVAYVRALTWGSSPALALTAALAIFAIVLWANGLGSVLPLLAAKLRIDPTVVSGPVMSTLVDATGLFIYLTIAGVILGLR